MRFPARLLLICLSFLLLVIPLARPVFAQSTNQVFSNSLNDNVPQNVSTISQGILWGMLSFMSCLVGGVDVTSSTQKCLGYDGQTGKLGYVTSSSGGLIGFETSAIALLYSPPKFHVGDYIGYLRENFGIVKTANAQGPTGLDQLTPILNLWIAFRNVAYLLFVIVFVVIGFAIMLRAKIDPRTVMTIENQIPKIIVALVLVSFSYAIAGFVVDIMWLTTYVSINLFASLDPALQPANLTQHIASNPLDILNQLSTGGIWQLIMQPASSVYDIMVPVVKNLVNVPFLGGLLGTIPCIFQEIGGFITHPLNTIGSTIGNIFGIGGQNVAQAWGNCVSDALIGAVSGITGIVAFLIFAFALAFALFRMYFTLLKSYALFLIYAILGPFFILLGVLPGTKINFDNWLRHLLAYSLVFPYAIGIMMMGKVLADVYTNAKVGFTPPLIGASQGIISPIGPLIGFAIILLMPQALTMLQDALSAPDLKYLPGLGQTLAGGTQIYSSLVSSPWKRLTRQQDSVHGLSEGRLRTMFMNIPIWPGRTIRNLAGENLKS